MNAVELFLKDGRPSSVWYCDKCRIVGRTREQTEQCCSPYKCKQCGAEVSQYYTQCDACSKAERYRKEREQFEKSTKLTEWSGWVYCDGVGYNEGFFDSVQSLIEHYEDEQNNLPEYVWTCKPNHFAVARVHDLTDQIYDNAYEDFEVDNLNGLDELKKAIDAFNEANKDTVSYEPDYSTSVLLEGYL